MLGFLKAVAVTVLANLASEASGIVATMDPSCPEYANGEPCMTHADPPPAYTAAPSAPRGIPELCLPALTEEDIKEALVQFVSEHCCYSKKPLREILIRSIEPATTYHFRLESFMEKRDTFNVEEPYDGSYIDGSTCGSAPDMWAIPIFHEPFKNGEKQAQLPHTTKVVACCKCASVGRKPCTHCTGRGRVTCTSCSMGGHSSTICHSCNGNRDVLCKGCNGVGQKLCERCQGQGRLKSYLCVKSVAKTYTVDKVIASERSVPSDKIIKRGAGTVVYQDEAPVVSPIANFPDHRIIQTSNQAVPESFASHKQERMLRQRQIVNAVPVSEVACTYRDEEATFYVYGLNNKV